MAWLNGWTYRKAITITEQSGSDLTDYQVKIELNSSNFDFSKANADGSDIRFAADDGTTLLPYWIEEWDTTNQIGKVWVKIPSLLANSSTTLYLYYGNPNAVDADNPEGVFDFWDDFNGTELDTSKWEAFASGGNYSVANSYVTLSPVPNKNNAVALRSNVQFVNDIIVEAKVNPTSNTYYDLGLIKTENIITSVWHIFEEKNLGYSFEAQTVTTTATYSGYYLGRIDPGTKVILAGPVGKGQQLQEIIYKLTYTAEGKLIGQVIFLDGAIWATLQVTDTTYLNDNKYIVIWQGEYYKGWGGPSSWDWIRVRKYASVEPSVSIGVEETSGGVVYSESLLDTVSLSESSKSMLSIINADSINAVSLEKQNPNGLQVDVINTIDVQKASPTNFNRSLAYLTELELCNTTKVISDVATTLAYLKSSPTVPNSDIAVLSEVLTQVAIKVQSLSDAAGAVDLTTINALNRALEAISFLESLSPAVRFNISEFVATVDTLTDKLTTLIKEGATISELLTESTAGGVQIETILDGLTVGDSLISDLLVIHVAKLLLTDSLRGYPSSSLIDSINSLERTTTALSFKLIDSVNAGESTKFIPTMILKEIIPTLDSLISRSATVFIAIEDSIRALDNNKAMVTGRLIDTLTPAEALQVIAYQLAAAIVRLLSKIALLAALESVTAVLEQHKSIINKKVNLESRVRKLGG